MLSLATLLVREGRAKIYEAALGIATAVGLPVSTWQPGDPTRSLFHLEAEKLSTLEVVVANFIASGFLDFATGVWLKILAEQVYGVEVPDATYATTDVVLTNSGGGLYDDIQPGDLTFKNSITEKTYRNTTGGTLASGPGTTLTLTVVADEPGSASSASAGEIDAMVTTLLGVGCTNPIAAVGLDEQAPETTRQQCRNKLSSISPNGPSGGVAFVALNRKLTGTTGVTRVRPYGSSDTGDVVTYLAGPSGGVSEPDRAKVEAAVIRWATPLCITPALFSATNVVVPVTYELWLYSSVNKTVEAIAEEVETALEQMFAGREIGGDIIPPSETGALYQSLIESTIREVYKESFRVVVTSPAGDVPLLNSQVAALGAVTESIHLVVR